MKALVNFDKQLAAAVRAAAIGQRDHLLQHRDFVCLARVGTGVVGVAPWCAGFFSD
jgi:hypothetical protein